jgi:hypothetical protein
MILSWNPYKNVSFFKDPIVSGIGPEKPHLTNALQENSYKETYKKSC